MDAVIFFVQVFIILSVISAVYAGFRVIFRWISGGD
jgi:hypothetical protein